MANPDQSIQPVVPSYNIDYGPLTAREKTRFAKLRVQIKQATTKINQGFKELGKALTEIRKRRLYREEFGTFEAFCQAELGKSKRHVNRLIRAYDVVDQLLNAGVSSDILPDNERLIRELSNFAPADAKKLVLRANQLRLAQGKQRITIENVRAAMATEGGSIAVREQQVRELLRRFERIADELSKVSIGWGDVGPAEITKMRTALANIAALAARHLQSVPREFLDNEAEQTDEDA